MNNKEKALQILNETDKLGILHKGSLGESVAISCIVKALDEKDAIFKEFLEKEREELIEQIKIHQSRGYGYDNFEECYTYMAAKLLRMIEKIFGGK